MKPAQTSQKDRTVSIREDVIPIYSRTLRYSGFIGKGLIKCVRRQGHIKMGSTSFLLSSVGSVDYPREIRLSFAARQHFNSELSPEPLLEFEQI